MGLGSIIANAIKKLFKSGKTIKSLRKLGKGIVGARKLKKTAETESLLAKSAQALKRNGSSKAKRPGYKKSDVDSYEKLSPGKNRAPGHQNIAADNRIQAHHPIQNEWAERNVKGYDKNKAPSVLLESSSGKPHAKVSAAQRARRRAEGYGNDIKSEFNKGYKELIDAGVDPKTARKAMKDAYKYFDDLGGFK